MARPDVPDTDNTAAFVHELDADAFSTADGSNDHVRVTVTTNAGALDREQQLGLVMELSELVASAATLTPTRKSAIT
ncbi:hypothetical protein [Streptomyces sp. NBC_01483]|uniref:hypothetical protein n=1 Tax=Streptomyces sp. NBC_01483 TaxID=2903883 RepID=UPI002E2F138B|nr:hypothetical protein [Streptomyces sp. NBC_01483]